MEAEKHPQDTERVDALPYGENVTELTNKLEVAEAEAREQAELRRLAEEAKKNLENSMSELEEQKSSLVDKHKTLGLESENREKELMKEFRSKDSYIEGMHTEIESLKKTIKSKETQLMVKDGSLKRITTRNEELDQLVQQQQQEIDQSQKMTDDLLKARHGAEEMIKQLISGTHETETSGAEASGSGSWDDQIQQQAEMNMPGTSLQEEFNNMEDELVKYKSKVEDLELDLKWLIVEGNKVMRSTNPPIDTMALYKKNNTVYGIASTEIRWRQGHKKRRRKNKGRAGEVKEQADSDQGDEEPRTNEPVNLQSELGRSLEEGDNEMQSQPSEEPSKPPATYQDVGIQSVPEYESFGQQYDQPVKAVVSADFGVQFDTEKDIPCPVSDDFGELPGQSEAKIEPEPAGTDDRAVQTGEGTGEEIALAVSAPTPAPIVLMQPPAVVVPDSYWSSGEWVITLMTLAIVTFFVGGVYMLLVGNEARMERDMWLAANDTSRQATIYLVETMDWGAKISRLMGQNVVAASPPAF